MTNVVVRATSFEEEYGWLCGGACDTRSNYATGCTRYEQRSAIYLSRGLHLEKQYLRR